MQANQMTAQEKRKLKQSLVSYMTTHPVKSGLLSPYTFRYVTMALASLVLVLGASVGITHAAMSALPNQKLYPLKIWIEQVKSDNEKTPAAKIAFETTRIETRFHEASELAIKHELDATNSGIIESGIQNSQDTINNVANSISATDPELALAATNNLETTFSSNGKILSAIGQNTNQDLGTIILGAETTTQKLATEQVTFAQIVAMKPNVDTKSTAIATLATVEASLGSSATAPTPSTSTTNTTSTTVATTANNQTSSSVSVTTTASAAATPETTSAVVAAPDSTTANTVNTSSAVVAPTATTPNTTTAAQTLVTQAKLQMSAGSYSDAVVTLQKAQQILDEAGLTQSLENTYQVKVNPTDSTTSSDSTTATSSPSTIGASNSSPDSTATSDTSSAIVPTPATASASVSAATTLRAKLIK